ncbi:Piso0_001719 [Millerozyma farinosa CBS 7064]|uniref:Piso0_001719 protein n=1 Tax=Pichia sorbitophila (strain ATCC MYA-4447 / BCRC 22081 / CBS 7064 / NBRC 10061 / NRRL Y-12695) TaxID=559304 RepID=G8YLJ3_PICSO|nr:Piso0_001719 [Millerozyma farinosa CBS 7064]
MKKALPQHAKLSKESKECIQECVSEFISFITSQAADRCKLEKRRTLNGEDLLWAMYTLGFENYSETLKIYLAKYRQVSKFFQVAGWSVSSRPA